MFVFIPLFAAYVVGSVPSGYWFAKYFFDVDVTKLGSGNIGATNVARVLGNKKYFFYVFGFDFCKAYLTIFLCEKLVWSSELLLGVGVLLLVGNGCSVFLGCRGGKGVATTLGVLAFLFPVLSMVFVGVWVLVLLVAKQVFLASLAGAFSLLPGYFLTTNKIDFYEILFVVFVVGWVSVRHKQNVKGFLA